MTDEPSPVARILGAANYAEALKALIDVDMPQMLDVFHQLPGSVQEQLGVEAAKSIRRPDDDVARRGRMVWVLRELARSRNQSHAGAIAYLVLGGVDDDDLRSVALDTLDALWLANAIPAERFRGWVETLPDNLPPHTRARWLRLLAEVEWGAESLRQAYIAERRQDVLDALVSSVDDRRSREVLDELYASAPPESERSRLEAALLALDVRSAKTAAVRGEQRLSSHQTKVLLRAHEFAVLHSALAKGLVDQTDLIELRDSSPPAGLSKSQRHFFRKLQHWVQELQDA